ncbi:MAG: tRNA (adenosine(37)-N6)-threonylcarbamoyltransferase complex dimerization subunit type 1 TsaB [Dehalococcoidia bacterium]|nr:tRNA (adenosine(37)-N6)-threonylcarbamoyltransferase complex dimerization subunit type 1 TsaB [Dehalococcoidia bacterium]
MYLAIDTTGDCAGLALHENGSLLAEQSWKCGKNHTVELLPRLTELLVRTNRVVTDIKGVIAARGPGSFNGLRVGLGTAKGLAFGLNVPIVGVSTLEAAAWQHAAAGLPVCAILDAGRGEIAHAVYQLRETAWLRLVPESLTTVQELCVRTEDRTIFCGEPLPTMLDEIRATLRDMAVIPSAKEMSRRPAFLAELGAKRLEADDTDDVAALQPIYLRRPNISQPKSKAAGEGQRRPDFYIIWDMDGTIVDTADQHYAAWKQIFAKRGIVFTPEDFKRGFGLRNDTIIRDIMGAETCGETVDAISSEKTLLFRDAIKRDGVKAMPGAVELLKALHEQGAPMAVASSAPQRSIETFLDMLDISMLFGAIVSGDEVKNGKPDPEIFLTAARKLGATQKNCVVIEDAVGGVAAAKAAGMRVVGVAASHPRKSLESADIVVKSLSELVAGDIEKLARS